MFHIAPGPSSWTWIPLLMLAGMASCVGEAPMPLDLSPGVSWALAQHRKATLSELAYAYELTIPERRDAAIQAHATIRFRWTDPSGRPLALDFLEPERMRAVLVNGRPSSFEGTDEHVVVPPDGLVSGEENRIELDFTAGDGSLNRSDDFLYTLFVPERARFSLPVFDQPNLKGRFAVTLTVPAGWTAVANGPLLDVTESRLEGGEAASTYRFAESRPLPPYLFAFVAGRFRIETAERNGRELRLIHRETDEEKVERNLEAIFDLHATALAWLEEYTGVPYPFQKFDFVAIPSFQYGGMEHAGAILYQASSLFLEESATQAQQLGRASVIAHETAHMWFGDLVTMNWFDDVWMKEVFANFMAAKIVHPSFPDVDHELRFLTHHQAAYEVDRTPGANPIRQPLDNLAEAGTLYGAIIYQKAPVVMKLLEDLVGESTFQDGLRHYLHAFRYDNATWLDLVQILDLLSPEDVAAWSRVWVEDAGRPTVQVAWDDEGDGGLTVVQDDPAGQGRLWPQHLTVLEGRGGSLERHSLRLTDAAATVSGTAGRTAPDFVLPESRAMGYARFRLDPDSRAYLLDHATELEDPVARGVAWLTLWDAVLYGEIPPPAFLDALLRGVETESDELNLQRVLGFLEQTYWRLTADGERRDREGEVEATLWKKLNASPTRTARASLFATYRDVALTDAAVARLHRVWSRDEEVPGLPLSEPDYTTLAYELAIREVPDWEAILERQGEAIENPDRRAYFEFVRPALSADRSERDRFFESLRDPARREHEPWVLTAVRYLHHPLRAAQAEVYLLPSLELVEEIQRTGDIFFPGRWLDATLAGHNSSSSAAVVEGFLRARPDYPPRLRAKILQSADPLMRAARILEDT